MGPCPVGTPTHPVVVSYDNRGSRKEKTFTDLYESRRFYIRKFKDGKNPNIRKAE